MFYADISYLYLKYHTFYKKMILCINLALLLQKYKNTISIIISLFQKFFIGLNSILAESLALMKIRNNVYKSNSVELKRVAND